MRKVEVLTEEEKQELEAIKRTIQPIQREIEHQEYY